MDQEELERPNKTLDRMTRSAVSGRVRFICLRGIFLYGLPLGFVLGAVTVLLDLWNVPAMLVGDFAVGLVIGCIHANQEWNKLHKQKHDTAI